jgi:serpin B
VSSLCYQQKKVSINFFKIANKIYVQNGFTIKPNFNEIATKKFNSEAQSLNFDESVKSAKVINDWVEDCTNGKIKDLVKSDVLNSQTRIVIVNAIYFKGLWEEPFYKSSNIKDKFYLNEQNSVDVDFMRNFGDYFKYADLPELNSVAFEMAYKSSDVGMMIVVPKTRTGLADLERNLYQVDFNEISSKMTEKYLHLQMPKFKIEFELDLQKTLVQVRLTFLHNLFFIY